MKINFLEGENPRNKVLIILLAILLVLSPLIYIGLLQDPSNLPRYAFLAFISTISFLIFSLFLFKDYSQIYYSRVTYLVLGYLVFAGISSYWAVEPGNNLVYFVQLVSLVLMFLLVIQVANVSTTKLLVYASLFAAGLSALIGLFQNYGYNIFELRGPAMGGTFGYKNHAALYYDLIIPVGVVITLVSRDKVLKWFSALALTVCLIYIISSHTRGSYVAMLAVLVLVTGVCIVLPEIRRSFFSAIKRSKLVVLTVFLLTVAGSFIPGSADSFLDRPAYAGDKLDTSTRDRLTAYSNSISLFKENPVLGTGYGTFWKAFRPYTNHPDIILRSDENIVLYRLHNDLLQIFLELGLIGGLLFITIIFSTYVIGYKLIKHLDKDSEKLLVVGMLLAVSGSLVHSLVDFPLLKPSSAIQFWIYLGLITGLYARFRDNTISIKKDYHKVVIASLSIILTISAFIYYRSFIIGNYFARIAETSFQDKNCHDALAYIDKSIEEFRHDFFAHKFRVQFHVHCNKDTRQLFSVLNEELRWDDTNPMALLTRGHIYLNSNYPDQAMQDFDKVMFLLPHRPSGYIGQALVLLASGQHDKAEAILNDLLAKHPENTGVKQAIEKVQQYKNRQAQ